MRIWVFLHLCQDLVLFFLKFGPYIVIFICIFLVTSAVEHLFIFYWPFGYNLCEIVVHFFCLYFYWVPFLVPIGWFGVPYILSPLLGIYIANIFSTLAFLFSLTGVFWWTKVNLNVVQFINISFMITPFCVLRSLYSPQGHENIVFSSKSFSFRYWLHLQCKYKEELMCLLWSWGQDTFFNFIWISAYSRTIYWEE